jgi:hypothetical protein
MLQRRRWPCQISPFRLGLAGQGEGNFPSATGSLTSSCCSGDMSPLLACVLSESASSSDSQQLLLLVTRCGFGCLEFCCFSPPRRPPQSSERPAAPFALRLLHEVVFALAAARRSHTAAGLDLDTGPRLHGLSLHLLRHLQVPRPK